MLSDAFPRRANRLLPLVARRTEARRLVLPPRECGGRKRARGRARTQKEGGRERESGKEGGATINTPASLWPAAEAQALPPGREAQPEPFPNTAREVKQGAGMAAPGPSLPRERGKTRGEWKADAA